MRKPTITSARKPNTDPRVAPIIKELLLPEPAAIAVGDVVAVDGGEVVLSAGDDVAEAAEGEGEGVEGTLLKKVFASTQPFADELNIATGDWSLPPVMATIPAGSWAKEKPLRVAVGASVLLYGGTLLPCCRFQCFKGYLRFLFLEGLMAFCGIGYVDTVLGDALSSKTCSTLLPSLPSRIAAWTLLISSKPFLSIMFNCDHPCSLLNSHTCWLPGLPPTYRAWLELYGKSIGDIAGGAAEVYALTIKGGTREMVKVADDGWYESS